jgi:soluble lytic murein transglycosylase
MIRFLVKFIVCVLLAAAAGMAYLTLRTGDTAYRVHEWLSPKRFYQHDALIRAAAEEHGVDPMLVKAVVWRESRFQAEMAGGAGERGLMQVGEAAATDWARDNRVGDFDMEDLFDPKVNLTVGTWYLARALERWRHQSDPVPFALAEYNAGASRALRWAGGRSTMPIPPEEFRANMDFPGTRAYIDSIMARRDFYKRRGRM